MLLLLRSVLPPRCTQQELRHGPDPQPAEFGRTWSTRARWRVGGGWRTSSSQQKAPLEVPADSGPFCWVP